MDEYDLYYGDYGAEDSYGYSSGDYGGPENEAYSGGGGGSFADGSTYLPPGYGTGGGGYSAPGGGGNNIIRSMAEADAERQADKEWAARGSSGAPKGGSSTTIRGNTMYGGGTFGGGVARPTAPVVAPLTYPELKMPEWDEGRVKALSQQAAAPYTRRLRESVQKAMGGRYENPNVKRMTLRDALAGYGTALEGVMGRANAEGRGAYAQEYSRQATETQANWQKEIQRKNMEYQTQVNQANSEYQMLMKEFFASNYPSQSGAGSRAPYGYNSSTWQ